MSDTDTYDRLTIGEVAARFGVTVPTVRAWERAGKITAVRTPGNQRRFNRADVEALLSPSGDTA
jgi:MerR family redox-sensitive transcriptional activator SoxR